MTLKAIVTALLLVSLPAAAQAPDAPTAVTLTPAQVEAVGRRLTACEVERDALRVTVVQAPSVPVVVALVVAGVVLGGAAGAGIVLGAQSLRK